jgi:hypothetical protein
MFSPLKSKWPIANGDKMPLTISSALPQNCLSHGKKEEIRIGLGVLMQDEIKQPLRGCATPRHAAQLSYKVTLSRR